MNLIERLKHLEASVDETGDDEIRVASGWPEYMWEVEKALPKLLAVVEAAKLVNAENTRSRFAYDRELADALAALEVNDAP